MDIKNDAKWGSILSNETTRGREKKSGTSGMDAKRLEAFLGRSSHQSSDFFAVSYEIVPNFLL